MTTAAAMTAEHDGRQPRRWRELDGVALLDKPAGVSSNEALQRLRRHLAAAKAGHSGTLDPSATGLLIIAFGEATKFVQRWLDADKTYRFTVQFGVATDTGDAEGLVTSRGETALTAEEVAAVVPRFLGKLAQVPPMYSALKHRGVPLYELARRGEEVPRQAREITVQALELLTFDAAAQRGEWVATVSKGTYIRTLAEDIAAALGVPAHTVSLRRERIGRFEVAAARTLAQWLACSRKEAEAALLPVDALVADLPAVILPSEQAAVFRQGQRVALAPQGARGPRSFVVEATSESSVPVDALFGSVRVYVRQSRGVSFLGVGKMSHGHLSPQRLVAKLMAPSPQSALSSFL